MHGMEHKINRNKFQYSVLLVPPEPRHLRPGVFGGGGE
jgi:hypothetical protein